MGPDQRSQIRVQTEIADVIRLFTKAVLQEQKRGNTVDNTMDLIGFAKEWFRRKSKEVAAGAQTSKSAAISDEGSDEIVIGSSSAVAVVVEVVVVGRGGSSDQCG